VREPLSGIDLRNIIRAQPVDQAVGGDAIRREKQPLPPSTLQACLECDAILLDTWSAKSPGGTGEVFPWSVAAALQPHVNRLILAGGLTVGNVADAIRMVRPFAVDVCSGVEDGLGRKDHLKVRHFIAAVRALEEEKVSSE
jgi:phosphoribosylanthranilate isomerase